MASLVAVVRMAVDQNVHFYITQTVSGESEKGDWLRHNAIIAAVFGLPTVPVPLFGR